MNKLALPIKNYRTFNPAFWAYLFIGVHCIIWTMMPALVRYNLPLDAIEGTIWGHQLEWGYDKNPFLNGWLTALATTLTGQSGWGVYLFSQLSVAACFWVVWQLGKNILTPAFALIALLLLESVQYFNFHAIDFNDNTLELGLWALTIYSFYRALRTEKALFWMLTGSFAAFGMMAKYYTSALLAAMFLYLCLYARNRVVFKKPAFYFGLLTFFLIILPHTIWLFHHDFITVKYVFDRAANKPSLFNHLFFPAQFALQQFQTFIPALVLFACLFIGKKPRVANPQLIVKDADKTFIFWVGLGPFLLTLLLSFFFGITLRAGWGMPLISFWSILLIAFIQPSLTATKVHRFITFIFTLLIALSFAYYFSLAYSKDSSSANFPGKEIAAHITKAWRDKYQTPLSYVAGSRWVGGNIEFYSSDHPAVFVEWDKNRAPWIDIQNLEQKGGVFVWSMTDREFMPEEIRSRFPRLMQTEIMAFDWHRNVNHIEPIKIGIAYLPPANGSNGSPK